MATHPTHRIAEDTSEKIARHEAVQLIKKALFDQNPVPLIAALQFAGFNNQYAGQPKQYLERVDTQSLSLLQTLGHNTTCFHLMEAMENAEKDLDFWHGEYRLLALDGRWHDLSISRRGEITFQGKAVNDFLFTPERVLEFYADGWHGWLEFWANGPLVDEQPANAGAEDLNRPACGLPDMQQLLVKKCVGTLDGRQGESEVVAGKIGTYSQEGLRYELPGDPAGFWNGRYRVTEWDDKLAQLGDADQPLQLIASGGAERLVFDWQGRSRTLGRISYGNNTLMCQDKGEKLQTILNFYVDERGVKRLRGARYDEEAGEAKSWLAGYLVEEIRVPKGESRNAPRLRASARGTAPFTITVNGVPAASGTIVLPFKASEAVDFQLGVQDTNGKNCSAEWALTTTSTALPTGLQLALDGHLRGTLSTPPTTNSSYSIEIKADKIDGVATDSKTGQFTLSIRVSPVAPYSVTVGGVVQTGSSTTLPALDPSDFCMVQLGISDSSVPPEKWPATWKTVQALPGDLKLTADGWLIGSLSVKQAATYTLKLRADQIGSNASATSGDRSFDLAVKNKFQITTTTLPDIEMDKIYTSTVAADFGTAPYKWTIEDSGGLSLVFKENGQIVSGTVTRNSATGQDEVKEAAISNPAYGQYSITVAATDASTPPLKVTRRFTVNAKRNASPELQLKDIAPWLAVGVSALMNVFLIIIACRKVGPERNQIKNNVRKTDLELEMMPDDDGYKEEKRKLEKKKLSYELMQVKMDKAQLRVAQQEAITNIAKAKIEYRTALGDDIRSVEKELVNSGTDFSKHFRILTRKFAGDIARMFPPDQQIDLALQEKAMTELVRPGLEIGTIENVNEWTERYTIRTLKSRALSLTKAVREYERVLDNYKKINTSMEKRIAEIAEQMKDTEDELRKQDLEYERRYLMEKKTALEKSMTDRELERRDLKDKINEELDKEFDKKAKEYFKV